MEQLLEITDLCCGYEDKAVVREISMSMQSGQLVSLLGPSGCGKTTVLRAIAGLEPVVSGEIYLNGKLVSKTDMTVPPEQRGVGMVFQDFALFPHLTVASNIRFGLRHLSRADQHSRTVELLALVGLEEHAEHYPDELSGGQQQRVALARALAPKPRLLLMDETFSSLDVSLRERLAIDVRNILKDQGTAALFVTHDQNEAFLIGERIAVMRKGCIEQIDTPFNLYHEPVNRFVANFIGQGRFLFSRLVAPDTVDTAIGILSGNRAYGWPKGSPVAVLLRPDDLVLNEQESRDSTRCEVIDRAFRGAETLYTLKLDGGGELLSQMPSHHDFVIGQQVYLEPHLDHMVLFDR